MNTYPRNVVVIDFGSSKIKGALAEKEEGGRLHIKAYASAPSNGCVLRGRLFNVSSAAQAVSQIVAQLEQQSHQRIRQVYVNFGGQSLQTADFSKSAQFDSLHEITQADLDQLQTAIQEHQHPTYEVLTTDSHLYFVNNIPTASPVGVRGISLEARFKLILARPEMRDNIEVLFGEKLQLPIRDLLISPLALSHAFLSKGHRRLGCALIDFGHSTTTLSVYSQGMLVGIRVLPMGGHLITQDLITLNLTESEAERIKCEEGSAIVEDRDRSMITSTAADGFTTKQISKYEVCRLIEARVDELVTNIEHQLKNILPFNSLGEGIIITGGASLLNGLDRKLNLKTNLPVRHASTLLSNDKLNSAYLSSPSLHLLYAMSCYADEECCSSPYEVEERTTTETEKKEDNVKPEETIPVSTPETVPSRYAEDELWEDRPTKESTRLFPREEPQPHYEEKKESKKGDNQQNVHNVKVRNRSENSFKKWMDNMWNKALPSLPEDNE